MENNHIAYDTLPIEITDAQQTAHDLLAALQGPTPDKTALKALLQKLGSTAEGDAKAGAVESAQRILDATLRGDGGAALDLDAISAFIDKPEHKPVVAARWQPATFFQEWLVENWLPHRAVTMLTGQGGVGKSRLALQLAWALATGTQWLGQAGKMPTPGGTYGGDFIPLEPVSTLYATWEDSRAQIQGRLHWLTSGYHVDAQFYGADMRAYGAMWSGASAGQAPRLTKAGVELRAEAERLNAKILVVDTLGVANRASEIDRAEVGAFFADFSYWADTAGCAVLLVAHPPKTDSIYSGSTGMLGGVRALLNLERVEDKCSHSAHSDGEPCVKPYAYRLRNAKQNYAPDGMRSIWLRNDNGLWVEDARPTWITENQSGEKTAPTIATEGRQIQYEQRDFE